MNITSAKNEVARHVGYKDWPELEEDFLDRHKYNALIDCFKDAVRTYQESKGTKKPQNESGAREG
jgi:hypothetical protein